MEIDGYAVVSFLFVSFVRFVANPFFSPLAKAQTWK